MINQPMSDCVDSPTGVWLWLVYELVEGFVCVCVCE